MSDATLWTQLRLLPTLERQKFIWIVTVIAQVGRTAQGFPSFLTCTDGAGLVCEGFEIEFAKELCRELNADCETVVLDSLDQRITALENGAHQCLFVAALKNPHYERENKEAMKIVFLWNFPSCKALW